MDEDYPGLLLGLFYEQSLTDNTWTQHSEETHTHIIINMLYENRLQDSELSMSTSTDALYTHTFTKDKSISRTFASWEKKKKRRKRNQQYSINNAG